MKKKDLKTGISIPDCVISEPKIYEEYIRIYNTENTPSLLVRFLDLPESKMYTVQVGFKIGIGQKVKTNAKTEKIKSTILAGIIVWGINWSVPKSYKQL